MTALIVIAYYIIGIVVAGVTLSKETQLSSYFVYGDAVFYMLLWPLVINVAFVLWIARAIHKVRKM